MNRTITSKLSYANVMATFAVLTAMSGTAYAAATINSADIVNESIRSVDIKNGEVRSADITNGTITTGDLAASALNALNNVDTKVYGTAVPVAAGGTREETVNCPAGQVATGGGGYSYLPDKGYLSMSTPKFGPDGETPVGWTVRMQNLVGQQNHLIVRAICA